MLDHARPAVGNTVHAATAQVKLWFSEEIEPAFSSLRVLDASGKEIDKGDEAQNVLLIGLSAALVASTAWAGHAVSRSGVAGLILLSVQVIHLLAADAWLGSLPALGYVVYKAQGDREGAWRATARYVLPRYSQAGYAAVTLILLTGTVNSWFLVGAFMPFSARPMAASWSQRSVLS